MGAAPASVEQALASPGRPLESALRQDMEQRFGHDFSRVRVHFGAVAEQSARDVNAHAYTVGRNIVFGTGKFVPVTHEGRRLLAHELTHVVQQSSADASRARHNNDNFGGATISQPVMEGGSVARCVQRQPAPPAEIEMPAEWAFAADKRKRTWRRYARSLGKKDAARIRKSGKLSSADREEVNAKLRFFEGDAMWAYIAEVKPALVEVTREEIEMPAEYVGTVDTQKEKKAVKFTVESDHGFRGRYIVFFSKPLTRDGVLGILFEGGTLPQALQLEEVGIQIQGWAWRLTAASGVIDAGTYQQFTPALAKHFNPETLRLTEEESEAIHAREEAFMASRPVYLGGQSVREAFQECKDHNVGGNCWVHILAQPEHPF